MSSQQITKEQVKKIAQLAKLDVTGQEEKFADLFTDTLKKIDVLRELDTSNVKETFQVTGLSNVFQGEESIRATLSKKEALSNAKEKVDGLFATEPVFVFER